jgi:LAO/AO transport system kinase
MGFDLVLVETVGVGQDEIDVVSAAHTSVVVTVPGLGDDIQAIKAGILEIADVLVVNKADREGADRTVRDLTQMLELRAGSHDKRIEIVKTVATQGAGIDDLIGAIDRHRQAQVGEVGLARARARARRRLLDLVQGRLADETAQALEAMGGLDALADEIVARKQDPYAAADRVVAALLARDSSHGGPGASGGA